LVCLKTVPEWFLKENYPEGLRDSENAPCRWTDLPEPVEPHPKNFASPAAYDAAKARYEQKLTVYNADIEAIRLDPASYTAFAKAAFQFIARYGSNKNLDPSLVTPFSGNRNPKLDWIKQKKKIGLGYVKAIECNNEPNAWWKGRKRYQTAREYAANLSAFYDGHMGTLGPGVGVKNADPEVLVVMGGIVENSPAYVQGIIDWCKENRGYREDGSVNLCFDVANFHSYANNGGGQYANASWGIPPEMSEAADVEAWSFLQVLSEMGNDVPVYVTETGYGVNEGSSQQALATPARTKLQSHADWTIRNSLFYARMGVARLYHYQMYDETSYVNNLKKGKQDRGTYAALGLLDKLHYTRRPAANYIAQLKHQFGEYTYKETIHKDPVVDVYELNGKKMYALVVPDMQGRSTDYVLTLDKPFANIYEFADGAERFRVKRVPTKNGKLRITVTETPVFVDAP
ncbi:MAG: hypothetical protein LPK07_00735, partial [Hymenobacteraceae bacterium]|nr:hypothetical protein [Hymenobacteraceae bacterium]